jgi:hypothetical protein
LVLYGVLKFITTGFFNFSIGPVFHTLEKTKSIKAGKVKFRIISGFINKI